MDIAQIAIFVLGVTAIYLANDPRPRVRRWACIIGMCSQPFWFMTTYAHHQWGIFASAILYTAMWARGIWHQWLTPTSNC